MRSCAGLRRWSVLAAVGLLGLPLAGGAAAPVDSQAEVSYLLGYIESSGCEFYRNGSTFDAARAAAHLRDKYAALGAIGKSGTAEAFIDKVASRSSFTGRIYEVRCAGQERMWTAPWLRDVLERFRSNGAPRS